MYVPTRALGAITWRGDQSDATVLGLQRSVNQVLRSKGCHSIGEDGKVGPETCEAILHAVSLYPTETSGIASTINQVLGVCQQYTNYTCQASSGQPASSSPVTQVSPEELDLEPTSRISTANMVMIGTGLAALVVVGYAIAKKKGLIK